MIHERMTNQAKNRIAFLYPDAFPGKPPKSYRQKRAVGLFLCLARSYGQACHEILRAKTTVEGDIYLTVRKVGFHEAFHKSGEFHWTWEREGKHVKPQYGEQDFPVAFKLWLKFRKPSCICFRRGRLLQKEQIVRLVPSLARYLPIEINSEQASEDLCEKGFYKLTIEL